MSDQDKRNAKSNAKPQDQLADNVIRFPVEKVRQKNKLKRLAGKLGDNKKSTLFLSMLSVLVMSAYLLRDVQSNGRYVASAIDNRDPQKEAELNDSLQESNRRLPASYGRQPTAEEKLREQELNRGYQIKYSGTDGLVVEATYQKDETDTEMFEPVLIKSGDLKAFLMRNREAISPGYDEVKVEGANYVLTRNGTTVGVVTFQFDGHGKLLSMKVQVL